MQEYILCNYFYETLEKTKLIYNGRKQINSYLEPGVKGFVMVILFVNLTGLKDAQRASKTFFLGVSMRLFPEEINI